MQTDTLTMRNKLINSIIRNIFENVLILDNISLLIVIHIVKKNTKKDHIINSNEKTQSNNYEEVARPGRKENERAIQC